MNRKDDYDSYEIEEPSDEEGAASRYITMISYVQCTHVNKHMWTSTGLYIGLYVLVKYIGINIRGYLIEWLFSFES